MNRYSSLFLALFFVGTAACGGGNSGFLVPADTALNPWVTPAAEDLAGDEGDDGEEEDYEDYEDGEDAEVAAPAVTPAAPTQ